MRGWLAILVVSAMVGTAWGQIGVARAVEAGTGSRQANPLEPSGFPGLESRDGALPAPLDTTLKAFRIVRAGGVSRTGDRVSLTGGALILYEGYEASADSISGDLSTKVFNLVGDAKLTGTDGVVRGASVEIDFDRKRYHAVGAFAQLAPTLLKGRVRDDVYVRGESTRGTEDHVHTDDGGLTTCNLDEAHFDLRADSIDVYPGRKAILRRVDFNVLGKTLFTLPSISIPLREDSDRYLPDVGQSEDEGYYVKTRYGVPLAREDTFDARLDYYTKLGAGLGGDYDYRSLSTEGKLKAYGIVGNSSTLELENRHTQTWKLGKLTLDNNFQQRNYLDAPQTTTLISRGAFDFTRQQGASRVTFYRTSSQQNDFDYSQQTLGLTDTRQFGTKSTTNFDLNWVKSRSAGPTNTIERQRIDLRVKARHDLKKATADFEYNRSIPVGENANFFSSTDRTPVLTLRSDFGRLFGQGFGAALPGNAELSLGEFRDPVGKDSVQRGSFDLGLNKDVKLGKGLSLNSDGRLRQGFYSDDTAIYSTGLGANLRWDIGQQSGVNVRYSFLDWHGYSPLQFDRQSRNNFLSMDLNLRPIRTLLIGAQTGYDFGREEEISSSTRWQTIGLRTEWNPKSWFKLRTVSTYDTMRQDIGNIRVDMLYLPGDTTVSFGARYDGIRHTWGNTNLFIDGLKWGRFKFSTLLAYNGYLKRFETTHYSVTYDMHCAEAILQVLDNTVGYRSGRQIVFMIRLKAFPFDTPFGTGTRGQAIGTGSGGYSF